MNSNTNEQNYEHEDSVTEELSIMLKIKTQLEAWPDHLQSPEYQSVVTIVDAYLKARCFHQWVQDTIDINPDHSQQICYCTICYTEFKDFYTK